MNFRPRKQDDDEALPVRGRINADKAAHILGFEAHHIPVLVEQRLLEPLGDPVENATKYFALSYVLALADDPKWLDKATRVVYQHWKTKNAKRKLKTPEMSVAA